MKVQNAQAILFWIIITSLIISLGSLWLGYAQRQYFPDEFQSLVLQSLGQFAGPLSIVIGSYFAFRLGPKIRLVASGSLTLAALCTVCWCAVTAGRTAVFVSSSSEPISTLAAWNEQIVTTASFLLNGVLAYFFTSSARE